MAKEMMYGEAIATAIIEEMQRDPNVIFYGQNMGMTKRDPMLKMFGKAEILPNRATISCESTSKLKK